MTCRDCLGKFSALSADDISATSAAAIHDHLLACPQCQGEWVLFERTLIVLSTSTQPLPSAQASEQMWQSCADHVFKKVENRRTARRSGLLGWMTQQPRWSWASLFVALTILGAAWLFAPHDEAFNVLTDGVNTVWRNSDTSHAGFGPGALVTFQRPPAATSGLINHHSAMAADPFADNVGSTLASYSATSPATTPAANAPTAPSVPVSTSVSTPLAVPTDSAPAPVMPGR
jgi:hypothetical protein